MLGDSIKRRQGEPRPPRKRPEKPARPKTPRKRMGTVLTPRRWLLLALLVLGGSFGVGYLLATEVLFPPPETAGTGVPVPDLYGETRAGAEARIRAVGLALGTVTEMRNMTTETGRVLGQTPLPGQQLRPGGRVSLGVSAGPPELRVPPLVGLSETTATELLEDMGFQVVVQQTRGDTAAAGVVTRADPPAGTARQLPLTVTLIVSTGPPDTIADTLGVF